jgi:ABC-2 type transport system ATP-binding protein
VRDDVALVLTVPTDDTPDALRDLLARLDGVAVERIALHTPDLDDVFLALTGAHDVELETTS